MIIPEQSRPTLALIRECYKQFLFEVNTEPYTHLAKIHRNALNSDDPERDRLFYLIGWGDGRARQTNGVLTWKDGDKTVDSWAGFIKPLRTDPQSEHSECIRMAWNLDRANADQGFFTFGFIEGWTEAICERFNS
jgi:hypothetical protein